MTLCDTGMYARVYYYFFMVYRHVFVYVSGWSYIIVVTSRKGNTNTYYVAHTYVKRKYRYIHGACTYVNNSCISKTCGGGYIPVP